MHLNCVGFAKRIVENIALRFPEGAQMAISYLYPRKLQLNGNEDEANIAMQMLATHYETLFNTFEFELSILSG
jgi:hypothetical protein